MSFTLWKNCSVMFRKRTARIKTQNPWKFIQILKKEGNYKNLCRKFLLKNCWFHKNSFFSTGKWRIFFTQLLNTEEQIWNRLFDCLDQIFIICSNSIVHGFSKRDFHLISKFSIETRQDWVKLSVVPSLDENSISWVNGCWKVFDSLGAQKQLFFVLSSLLKSGKGSKPFE